VLIYNSTVVSCPHFHFCCSVIYFQLRMLF
jgi:hypothetical protein